MLTPFQSCGIYRLKHLVCRAKGTLPGSLLSNREIGMLSVRAYEHREAAIAGGLTHRNRGLAVLVRSYRFV
jgi:hypothetical protein